MLPWLLTEIILSTKNAETEKNKVNINIKNKQKLIKQLTKKNLKPKPTKI